MLVIVPEIMGFGDRRLKADMEADPDGTKSNSCQAISVHLMMCGKTLAGVRIYEALRAIDYLEIRDDVDAEHIGTMGFSGGGLVSSFAAALDERIRAAVICGYTNTFKGSIMFRRHCIDNYVPGILEHAEQPDIYGLIAPRPLFIESGERDKIFPASTLEQAIEQLSITYKRMGARQNLESDIFPGGHEISGRRSFDWLAEKLRN
jgi:dienelactone hydrolase